MEAKAVRGAKFAAVQIEGAALFVSGLGVTKGAAVKDAEALTDTSAGLTVLPISTRAKEAIELRGGTNNKAVTLAVVTVAEFRILEALRRGELDAEARAQDRHQLREHPRLLVGDL